MKEEEDIIEIDTEEVQPYTPSIPSSNVFKDLEQQLLVENDVDNINHIVELFNVNLQKKNIIRSAKLSDIQDRLVDHINERISLEPEEFSNEDLIKYHKIIQDTLSKTSDNMDNIKVPSIQINQQVNVNNIEFDSDSRKRILSAVNSILNGEVDSNSLEIKKIEE